VSLDELGSLLESGGGGGRPPAAVTFDDGYRDVYEHAFPLLQRKGIPAAVFIVTDLVDTPGHQLHDKLYLLLARAISGRGRSWSLGRVLMGLDLCLRLPARLNGSLADPQALLRLLLARLSRAELQRLVGRLEAERPLGPGEMDEMRPLSWAMLGEMQRGGITVGSHTRSHALLPNESRPRRTDETAGSREAIEKKLGVEVRHFAYPDGRFNDDAVDAVRASGYRFAFTTCPHRDPRHPLLTIPRTLLWEESSTDAFGRFSSAMMGCHANGLLPFMPGCRAQHGRPAAGAHAESAS
jgi:peptidoglycan/xylan/chitin deacetylase (PgdA/CDA1 family)